MKFIVITDVDEHKEKGGNFAAALDLWVRTETGDPLNEKYEHAPFALSLNLYTSVFTKGEICIVDDEYGREIIGQGRKPSKWWIGYETFNTIEEAVNRAKELRDW